MWKHECMSVIVQLVSFSAHCEATSLEHFFSFFEAMRDILRQKVQKISPNSWHVWHTWPERSHTWDENEWTTADKTKMKVTCKNSSELERRPSVIEAIANRHVELVIH